MATDLTNADEDLEFYQGAQMQVLGTYFAYTDVPGSGQLLWSKGKSNAWQNVQIMNSGTAYSYLGCLATFILLQSF